MKSKTKGSSKGGNGDVRSTNYPPRGQTMTAGERTALSRLAKDDERRQKKKETKKIVAKVKKGLQKEGDSSSSTEPDDRSTSGSEDSSSEDAKKKKQAKRKSRKKDRKKKKKSSSSEDDESYSKGASKSKKKKLSKMGRLHQELQALKEEITVKQTEKEEFKKELAAKFAKLEAHLVEGKSVLHTPDKVPLTKEDLREALADAGSKAAEKAEASRPSKGILAWLDEVGPQATTPPPPKPTPSKQARQIATTMREWLDEVAHNAKKYVPLNLRNPTLNSKGGILCNHIAKKVSSWFVIPADLDLLTELVKDYSLQTQATTPATIIKALLTTLLSRGFDLDPEHLLVSKSDIMAMMK